MRRTNITTKIAQNILKKEIVMQFVKGVPYFCQGVNKIKQYPYLTKNIACDILVIGGGICGAVANYFLSQNIIQYL